MRNRVIKRLTHIHKPQLSGQATIELLLLMPVFMLLWLILLDTATLALSHQTATDATQQAARIMAADSSYLEPMSENELIERIEAANPVSAPHAWSIKVSNMSDLTYQDDANRETSYSRKVFTITCTVKAPLPLPLPDIPGMFEDGCAVSKVVNKSVLTVEEGSKDGSWG